MISINRTKGTPGTKYEFAYDYRSRRVERKRTKTSTGDPLVPASYGMPTATGSERIVFSGGLSVREYSGTTSTVVADYVRGSDWGGGVGGIVYTLHGSAAMSANYSYNHYNARGDVTVKSNSGEGVVYAGDYTALGTRSKEYMAANNEDWQRSNTKDEDVPGYANEGFRFRDLETGVFINRDPAGFVDGPNLYCYVGQNPWSRFDPEGLNAQALLLVNPLTTPFIVLGGLAANIVGAHEFYVNKLNTTVRATNEMREASLRASHHAADYGAVGGGYAAERPNVPENTGRPIVKPPDPTETHGTTDPKPNFEVPGTPAQAPELPNEQINIETTPGQIGAFDTAKEAETYSPLGGAGNPALTGDPYSPAEVSKRQSEWRRQLQTGSIDPDSPIPNQGPGGNVKSTHEAKPSKAHDTQERNVGTQEEHSRVAKGSHGQRKR